MSGKVFIVGAGCGDFELIAVKALNILRKAQVVLYDNLISLELLKIPPSNCEFINVGKRFNTKSISQDEINSILIEKARQNKIVVRLKGGDPYVFGRGAEEMTALINAGIDCFEIPGITSAIGALAYAGIPVTSRELSRNFTVLTASSYSKELKKEVLTDIDYKSLSKIGGTIVILMGIHHLKELCDNFLAAGMNPEMPVAIIMNGTLSNQKVLRAELKSIAKTAIEQGFTNPSVVVIGQVASFDLTANKTNLRKPVIGIVGTNNFCEKLVDRTGCLDADIKNLSFLDISINDCNLPDFSMFNGIVFTSPNGVDAFFKLFFAKKNDLRKLMHLKFAVIGEGTAKRLLEYGFKTDIIPEIYDSQNLAMELVKNFTSEKKLLLCRANNASDEIDTILRDARINFENFTSYYINVNEMKKRICMDSLSELDYLVFGSAYGVETFFETFKDYKFLKNTKFICMGERCALPLKNMGLNNEIIIPSKASIDAIVSAIESELIKE